MRLAIAALAAFIVLISAVPSGATVRIADDRGGRIGTYIYKFASLREAGEDVMIDGTCASACTIVLGTVPAERICVTARAVLAFHAAWDYGPEGQPVTNPVATRLLYEIYPRHVRRWITQRGGLTRKMLFLRGRDLYTMYRPCP